ncbi:SCO family protein [Pontibacter akesuensis]|uniref:Protein SCO1/2 n=1 Tax=Pontibacter akesuensis TaxID=388950 RepID=A0A1I7GGC1_9BACT|nr:SCO family protein [Pontibacter akesuensis]GHA56997.1 hypothetical protein GCM10007389_05820 [Pontibacter akesuensis]SFU47463.1 protein SCO1/2 [Pontibacter akesuensis]
MKRFTYPLLLAFGFGLAACQPNDQHMATPATSKTQAQQRGALTDMSLYHLDAEWTDQQGQLVKLEKLRGKVQLVSMIYTSCSYACPRTMEDLKVLESRLSKYSDTELGIVLVTIDPANDTPEKLKLFAKGHNLNPAKWNLLTSEPENIQELAALLHVKYKNDFKGNISHSNTISVLNAAGELVYQQQGLGTSPDETVKAIEALSHTL